MIQFLLGLCLFFGALAANQTVKQVPLLYKGRVRPAEVAARLWLKELYGRETLRKVDQVRFGTKTALDLMWRMQTEGHAPFDEAPLFLVDGEHLSYNEIKQRNPEDPRLLDYEMIDPEGDGLLELQQRLLLAGYSQDLLAEQLEWMFPLWIRLEQAGSLFHVLPGEDGWYPLNAVEIGEENFTLYDDETFALIRANKEAPEKLAAVLHTAYSDLAGTPQRQAAGKRLTYPSHAQLSMEVLYYTWPLLPLLTLGYILAAFLIRRVPRLLLACFLLHTVILGMRCFILGRPPVSNMFETVLYVPWVAVLAGLILRSHVAVYGAAGLLLLLQFTGLDRSLENVQPVLDSQLWLSVHVLMVVGSYGVFLLAAILGHLYLIRRGNIRPLLHTLYIGTGLLIVGTILGGVWAAESWGRFWDWDPKESWAFVSAAIYLVGIHAYHFKLIRGFGLAMIACIGFLAITFTWYGVNYLLGTGLHQYGFGQGGLAWYLGALLLDSTFLGVVPLVSRARALPQR